ncbi:MAG: hypothetical protein M3362_05515, partial [Acidobacteriota bacterium]|nr:hypothetical protein [Acidobacteriota bacterium]
MLDLHLTAQPLYYDEHRQPCYLVEQDKGLIEFQDNHLLAGALADGYTMAVAENLFDWAREKLSLGSAGEPLDILEIGGGSGDFFERAKECAATYINIE